MNTFEPPNESSMESSLESSQSGLWFWLCVPQGRRPCVIANAFAHVQRPSASAPACAPAPLQSKRRATAARDMLAAI